MYNCIYICVYVYTFIYLQRFNAIRVRAWQLPVIQVDIYYRFPL